MNYFIGQAGKQLGPFNEDQVRAKLASGELSPDDLGWREGMPDWQPLRVLFSAATPPPPPPDYTPPAYNPASFPRSTTSFAPRSEEFLPVLGGRGARLGAVIIDQFIALAVCAPGLWQFFSPIIKQEISGENITPEQIMEMIMPALPLLLIPLLALVVVQLVLLTMRGQTLGKMLLRLRIVKLDGSNPGFVGAVILRSFLPGLIGGVPVIGPMFSLVDPLLIFREDKRCIHDLMAGTIVVEA